jgi:hypothetical protein
MLLFPSYVSQSDGRTLRLESRSILSPLRLLEKGSRVGFERASACDKTEVVSPQLDRRLLIWSVKLEGVMGELDECASTPTHVCSRSECDSEVRPSWGLHCSIGWANARDSAELFVPKQLDRRLLIWFAKLVTVRRR